MAVCASGVCMFVCVSLSLYIYMYYFNAVAFLQTSGIIVRFKKKIPMDKGAQQYTTLVQKRYCWIEKTP